MADESGNVLEVLQRARLGDRRSLYGLMESYRPRLRQMIRLRLDRRLQGRVDASDVIQEAFLDASSNLDGYLADRSMPFFLWLRFLTVQKLVGLHREHLGTQARDAKREISIDVAGDPDAASQALAGQLMGQLTSPSMAARRAEQAVRLEEALNGLGPVDREVILLRHFEELTNHETAQVLGLSPTAACNRHVRALKRLKEALAEMPGGIQEMEP